MPPPPAGAAAFPRRLHLSPCPSSFPSLCLSRYPSSSTAVRMSLSADGPSLAVLGSTSAVGQEFLQILDSREFPYRCSLKLLASPLSADKRVVFQGREYIVEELTQDSFEGVDIGLFSAGGGISREFGRLRWRRG